MRQLMLFCFGVGALWDGITTMLGIATILHAQNELDLALCFVGGLVIMGFSLGTHTIFSEDGFVFFAMRFLWGAAILFDIYTAFTGNAQYIVLKAQDLSAVTMQHLEPRQLIVVLVLTIMVSGSPIFISYMVEKPKRY